MTRPAVSPSGSSPGDSALDITGGVLFGGNGSLVVQQPALGRRLAVVRTYYLLGQSFPTATDASVMAEGSTLLVSLDLPPGDSLSSVAQGAYDAAVRAFLQQVAAAAAQAHLPAIYVCFEHEPDTAKHGADPVDFVNAWQHVYDLAQSAGLNWQQGGPLRWVWILTQSAFGQGLAQSYFPGHAFVDALGVDAYNVGTCRSAPAGSNAALTGSGSTPATLLAPAVAFASSHGDLPVVVAEWGTLPGPNPNSRASFIGAMAAYVAANPSIVAVLYWDSHGMDNGCDYAVDDDPPALAALASMGSEPLFQGALSG